jgi:hypothetical protein
LDQRHVHLRELDTSVFPMFGVGHETPNPLSR